MIVDVNRHAAQWERQGAAAVAALRHDKADGPAIKQRLDALAEQVLAATWQLSDDLMLKFADGGLTTAPDPATAKATPPDGTVSSHDLGYPAAWLRAAGFTAGPHRMGLPAVTQNPSPPAEAAAAAAVTGAAGTSQPQLFVKPPAAINRVGAAAVGVGTATSAPAAQPVAAGRLPVVLAGLVALMAAAALLAARRAVHARGASAWEPAALQLDREAPATGVEAEERAYVPW